MEVKFTEEQQAVIDARDCNILVSAAAGSGKTAVLVERIIRMISKDLDVDHLLVVTFTKAAAAQMKSKITAAIQKELSKDPENQHLQRQETLIHNAQITTIDSFCQYVIRNNFNTIGLDPAFRVADEGERTLLREEVMSELMEDEYAACEGDEDSDFLFAMEYFSTGSRDTKAEEYISQLYNYSISMPWPEDWLRERAADYEKSDTAFDELDWVKACVDEAVRILKDSAEKTEGIIKVALESDGPYMYESALQKDKDSILAALKHRTYDGLFDSLRGISFETLSPKKDPSVNPDKREYVKKVRAGIKEDIKGLVAKYFALTSETVLEQMQLCDRAVKELVRLTLAFKERYDSRKREKQLIDFSDMEHFALEILVNHPAPSECEGCTAASIMEKCTPSQVALEYREFFKEVLIDEYQDSNNVQEMILKSIAGESAGISERFMVGDVKQSIYKFRQARPEIFMEKLGSFDKTPGAMDRRIDLHRNFRSRNEVLSGTNYIFKKIMGDDLGGVDYDEDANLVPGGSFDEPVYDVTPEFIMVDGNDLIDPSNPDEMFADMSPREKEALAVAERIVQLRRENKELKYKDIVILLRSLSGWDDVFKEVLESQGIPVYIESKSGYFEAPEVSVLLELLSVIDNPRQDIPLVAVMHSVMGGFSDEDLARIRVAINEADTEALSDSFYDGMKLLVTGENTGFLDGELLTRVKEFVNMIEEFRTMSTYTPVHELLEIIIDRSDYETIMTAFPAGNQRRANIEFLLSNAANFEKTSFKGLFHFVRYIEHLKVVQVDYGEAGIIDENANVVRIMSIHKSKGLEFPVVFVSGLSKEFNKRDTKGDLITDVDLGIGVKCINTDIRVKYDTLKRRIIAHKMEMDSLGEEIRVLYVALTRAREKLILTAYEKDLSKELSKALMEMPINGTSSRLLPYSKRCGAKNYFELLLPALIAHPGAEEIIRKYELPMDNFLEGRDTGDVPSFRFMAVGESSLKGNIVKDAIEAMSRRQELKSALDTVFDPEQEADIFDPELSGRLLDKFSFEYPHGALKGLFTKTSVSELKKNSYHEESEISVTEPDYGAEYEQEELMDMEKAPDGDLEDIKSTDAKSLNTEENSTLAKPERLTGAERGTAYHRIMELLDEDIYGNEELMQKAASLADFDGYAKNSENMRDQAAREVSRAVYIWGKKKVSRGWISPAEQASVYSPDVAAFLSTDLGQRMGSAFRRGELFREKPFMMGVSASELDERFPKEEMVIVQGIIDAWFIEEGKIVLLDYKTDRVKDAKTLVDRYRVQLDLYKRALEVATMRKVRQVYIYSFCLGKVIEL